MEQDLRIVCILDFCEVISEDEINSFLLHLSYITNIKFIKERGKLKQMDVNSLSLFSRGIESRAMTQQQYCIYLGVVIFFRECRAPVSNPRATSYVPGALPPKQNV